MSENDITEGVGLVTDVVTDSDLEGAWRDLLIGLAIAAAGFITVGAIGA